jgi:uncharacterized cupin superfamily protein
MTDQPPAVEAVGVPARARSSSYPEPFASRMEGRIKRPLGDLFGLKNFGVNLITLRPRAISALHHRHSRQDEFIYVIAGEPTLFIDARETKLFPGMVAGFAAGGAAHHLENRTERDCVILEVGDRASGDEGTYPNDDIRAVLDADGRWHYTHKNGTATSWMNIEQRSLWKD